MLRNTSSLLRAKLVDPAAKLAQSVMPERNALYSGSFKFLENTEDSAISYAEWA